MAGAKSVNLIAACVLAFGCSGPVAQPTAAMPPPPPPAPFKAVLIAGDGSLPVFDNAVHSVAALLQARHVIGADTQRMSSAQAELPQPGVLPATLEQVRDTIASLRPAAGQGCLVFATSHGVQNEGLWLGIGPEDAVLSPSALDAALVKGCGDAPTVVVVSACFSGGFARPPMARPNRIVLTASRIDRASFGCGAGREYTFFDACLLQALHEGGPWRQIFTLARACVLKTEQEGNFPGRSQPQAWIGANVANLGVPQ